MKRYLILLLVVHCSLLATRAQVGEYRNDLAVGVSAGYMLSSVGFVPEVPQKQLGGMTGGVTFRYTCEKYFKSVCAIVAEVNLVQTGWKENIMDMDNQPVYYVNDTEKANPLSYERHMKYVQVPIMARLGWGHERKGLQGFIQLGPQIGFFLDESTTSNLQPGIGTQTERSSKIVAQDTMAVQKKFDYGIAVGGGIEWDIRRIGRFSLEGRYYIGLGNIYDDSKKDEFGKSNHGTIFVKLAYLKDL
jgi:hypothetical protein